MDLPRPVEVTMQAPRPVDKETPKAWSTKDVNVPQSHLAGHCCSDAMASCPQLIDADRLHRDLEHLGLLGDPGCLGPAAFIVLIRRSLPAVQCTPRSRMTSCTRGPPFQAAVL